jgi:hypothetical protein
MELNKQSCKNKNALLIAFNNYTDWETNSPILNAKMMAKLLNTYNFNVNYLENPSLNNYKASLD